MSTSRILVVLLVAMAVLLGWAVLWRLSRPPAPEPWGPGDVDWSAVENGMGIDQIGKPEVPIPGERSKKESGDRFPPMNRAELAEELLMFSKKAEIIEGIDREERGDLPVKTAQEGDSAGTVESAAENQSLLLPESGEVARKPGDAGPDGAIAGDEKDRDAIKTGGGGAE